jgi:hypothetical protein
LVAKRKKRSWRATGSKPAADPSRLKQKELRKGFCLGVSTGITHQNEISICDPHVNEKIA